MQDKVSVYNNPMGGAPQAPPPRSEPIILFKRDGYIPPAQSLYDAIKMEQSSKKSNETLIKYYKMLLSSIFPKWNTEGNVPKQVKRKEKVEKPVERKIDLQIGKKFDEASDRFLLSIGKALLPVAKPPYKLIMSGLDLLGKGLVKADELIDQAILKLLVDPALLLYEKVMPPLQKAAAYISQTLAMTMAMLEREGERIIEFVIAPLAEALETVQIYAKKIYTPLKKARNWMAKKLPSIPKPSLSFEPLDRVLIKPLKTFINTFIATPAAKALQKMAEPIQKGSQFLAKKGTIAYAMVSTFSRTIGAKIGGILEVIFRRFGRLLRKLLAFLKKMAIKVAKLIRSLPDHLASAAKKLYHAACKLTQWAAKTFFLPPPS